MNKDTPKKVYIAIGGNMPSTQSKLRNNLESALAQLEDKTTQLLKVAPWYQTPPWPDPAAAPYLNSAAMYMTKQSPEDLLQRMLDIEAKVGRVRVHRWDARPCDLDLISYENQILPDLAHWQLLAELDQDQSAKAQADLVIPHPRAHLRGFVLLPLAELAPDWLHPVLKKNARQLLNELPAGALDGILKA